MSWFPKLGHYQHYRHTIPGVLNLAINNIWNPGRCLAKNTFSFVVMMIAVDTETIFTDVALITFRRMYEIMDWSQVSFEDQIPHQQMYTSVVFFAYCKIVLSVVLLDILLFIKLIMASSREKHQL